MASEVDFFTTCLSLLVFFFIVLLIIAWLVTCVCKIWSFLFGGRHIQEHKYNYDTIMKPRHIIPNPNYANTRRINECYRSKRVVALDTERIGGRMESYGREIDMLARVVVVDNYGRILIDKHVKPRWRVVDFRTLISGIRPNDIRYAQDFQSVRQEVEEILDGCILVGHDLKADLKCLEIDHPTNDIRDTAMYKGFRHPFMKSHEKPKLANLAYTKLRRIIQQGEHSPVEDARAAMDLYLLVAEEWEAEAELAC